MTSVVMTSVVNTKAISLWLQAVRFFDGLLSNYFPSMQYRRFGKTNLQISVFSLGTMRCLSSETTFYQVLKQGLSSGINHIETAQGYGESEKFLGRTLQRLQQESTKTLASESVPFASPLVITTKIPPTPDADEMARRIDISLERLQLDSIDCLAIHGINTWEHLAWVQAPQGCMQAVHQAVADGRIHHVGFSTHGPREVIAAAIHTDQFEFVNLHYYYFFQRHRPLLDLAQEKNLGVFIISPGDKGGQLYCPSPTLKDLCTPFHPLHLTYRWLLQDTRITTLSLGPATVEEMALPLGVRDQPQTLSPEERKALERLEIQQETTLASDQCRQCYACLPCPEAIHIPEVLRLRNLTVAYGMESFGQYRYRMFENAGHWFPGRKANRCTDCGDCLPRCPENLDIPSLLRDTHERLKGPEQRRLWG